MLQRYVDRFQGSPNVNGSVPHYAHPNRATLSKVVECPCSDGVRRTVFIQGEPDTYFSQPAAVSVKGKPARGYLTGTEGGPVFRFLTATRDAFGLPEVDLDDMTGNPTTWRRYAVSYGNGNDGLSHLYPSFTLDCHPDAIEAVARLAVTTSGRASKSYLAGAVHVDEIGEDTVQGLIFDPPRSSGWSDANGAWMLCDVYPADGEVSEQSQAPHYLSPVAAFGRAAAGI